MIKNCRNCADWLPKIDDGTGQSLSYGHCMKDDGSDHGSSTTFFFSCKDWRPIEYWTPSNKKQK